MDCAPVPLNRFDNRPTRNRLPKQKIKPLCASDGLEVLENLVAIDEPRVVTQDRSSHLVDGSLRKHRGQGACVD